MESRLKTANTAQPGVVVNPCKACAPLGASLAMKGVRGSMCILHGSQGCATYIRRFFIGHFREPVDIASSSFDESTAVFGGRENLIKGIKNIIEKYKPEVIGIATSCLAETIGEDVGMYMKELEMLAEAENLTFIHTDTAAYKGTHVNGFMKMTSAIAKLAEPSSAETGNSIQSENVKRLKINMIPWMVSPADIRGLKRLLDDIKIESVFLPDYSLTMDGGAWTDYEAIPQGGTSINDIRTMGAADHSIEFGEISSKFSSPAAVIEDKCGVDYSILPLPIGLKNTDLFLNRLVELGKQHGKPLELPDDLREQRLRLLDAYADSHKYFSGLKAGVYGEADFVLAMASFLCELGIEPAICMTGENISRESIELISSRIRHYGFNDAVVLADTDFDALDDAVETYRPEILIGNSRGYKTARKYDLPLVRAGFPIHDRFGGQRLLHLGYEGALRMTDEIANTIIAVRQAESPVGYMSM